MYSSILYLKLYLKDKVFVMAEDNKNQKNIIPNNIDIGSIIKLIIIRSDGEIPKREDKDKKPAYSSKWKDPALLAQILKNTVEKLNDFYEKNKRAPTREEVIEKLNLGPIISAISKNELSEERILTYNDLLKRAGLPTNREQGVWNNEEFANEKNKKINEAVEKLNDFYEKNGRAPTIKEARKWLNLGPIISAISLNKLSEEGIFMYNDLLRHAGLPINRGYILWSNANVANKEINKAVEKLKEFYEKNGKAPTREKAIKELNLGPIIDAITDKKLSEEGIFMYNDLLRHAGLPINRICRMQNNEEFVSKKLDKVVEKLNNFYEKNGRAPTVKEAKKDLNLGPIISAISLNKLSEKGIFRYNDLLRYAGLDVNQEHKVQNNEEFVSKELDKVMEKLKEFYEKNGRAPKIKEVIEKLGLRLIRSFIYTLYRYRFIKHISYNELLKHTGLPVNIKLIQNWWKDPEIANKEINEAVEKLKEFYEKNGRAPTVKELNYELHLKSIIYAAFKNRLIKYGISSYMDLLKRAGLV